MKGGPRAKRSKRVKNSGLLQVPESSRGRPARAQCDEPGKIDGEGASAGDDRSSWD
jgi:hypothetical protein